jgi:hypothetical protein
MIPLVGGSALGCARAAGSSPEYHLSYGAFGANETHLRRYWEERGTPWHCVDRADFPAYPDLQQGKMDFINSVCPCAGLSMLNRHKEGNVSMMLNLLVFIQIFIFILLSSRAADRTLCRTSGC